VGWRTNASNPLGLAITKIKSYYLCLIVVVWAISSRLSNAGNFAVEKFQRIAGGVAYPKQNALAKTPREMGCVLAVFFDRRKQHQWRARDARRTLA
jgi:hypothetical protein